MRATQVTMIAAAAVAVIAGTANAEPAEEMSKIVRRTLEQVVVVPQGRMLDATDCAQQAQEYSTCVLNAFNEISADAVAANPCSAAQTTFDKVMKCASGVDESCLAKSIDCDAMATEFENELKAAGLDCSISCGGLSAGAIAGIVIGVLVFLALVGLGVFCFIKKRRQANQANQMPPAQTPNTLEKV